MKRIKLILAVGAVMVAMLALNAGSTMADEIEEFDIDDNDDDIFDDDIFDDDDDEQEGIRVLDIG